MLIHIGTIGNTLTVQQNAIIMHVRRDDGYVSFSDEESDLITSGYVIEWCENTRRYWYTIIDQGNEQPIQHSMSCVRAEINCKAYFLAYAADVAA